MAELLDNVKSTLSNIDTQFTTLLESLDEYNNLYESDKLYVDTKDPELIKDQMKEKIDLAVNDYDSE